MENNPLVTVIVPIYKTEKFLNRCIDSIIKQTYSNLEIILVDDGSPDDSGKICDEYATLDKRIKVIHKENGGQSSARNSALDIASGDYVCFVDSDDYIESSLVYDNINILLKEASDMVVFNYCEILQGKIHPIDYLSNRDCSHKYFLFKAPVIIPARIYSAKIWKDLRFPTHLKIFEDNFLKPSIIARAKKISINPRHYYNYDRSNDNSVMTGVNLNSLFVKFLCAIEGLKVCDKYFPEYKNIQIAKAYRAAFKVYNVDLVINNLNYQQKSMLRDFFQSYEKETSSLSIREKIFIWGYKHCTLINKIKGWDHIRKSKKQ